MYLCIVWGWGRVRVVCSSECRGLQRPEEGLNSLESNLQLVGSCMMWVLGFELRSYRRTVHPLNHWAISQSHQPIFKVRISGQQEVQLVYQAWQTKFGPEVHKVEKENLNSCKVSSDPYIPYTKTNKCKKKNMSEFSMCTPSILLVLWAAVT